MIARVMPTIFEGGEAMTRPHARYERCGASGPLEGAIVDGTIPLVVVKRVCAAEPDPIFSVSDPALGLSWPPFCLWCLETLIEVALTKGDETFGQVFKRLRRAELQ